MPKKKSTTKPIEQYEHRDKERANIPPVGLVTPKTDPDKGDKKKYEYDPHLDPQLQWAGKAEHTSFEVPTVSLHVHERIDPKTIIDTVSKEHDDGGQLSLFAEKKPLREAIDFYKHKEGWTNRLIAGDSLLVMNSLLEKEGMAGKVQTVYFDPPYGIKYGSNFQPFVNKRDVKDGKDDDLSAEPEMIKAFRDTWELGIHSYLTYLRDRLLLARELLHESGSMFLQIGEENIHLVRTLLDEVFLVSNFVSQISVFKTTTPRKLIDNNLFYILWYAKDISKIQYNQLFIDKPCKEWTAETKGGSWGVTIDGKDRPLTPEEKSNTDLLPKEAEVYQLSGLTSDGASTNPEPFIFNGIEFLPGERSHWKTSVNGLYELVKKNRIESRGETGKPWFKKYHKDFPVKRLTNVWSDTSGKANERIYVVQTQNNVIARCIQMSTNPGDLVLDITCGSGTTAFVSEEFGRRWITCDTSRVAILLAKMRLMSADFDYYKLKHQKEGVSSGFEYETVPHITLKTFALNEPFSREELFDKPIKDSSRTRITGPFTVEAVPAPYAKSFDDLEYDTPEPMSSKGAESTGAYTAIARTGETLRQAEWRDELLRTGVRAKGGNMIHFTRVEPMGGTKFIQAEAETKENKPKKVLVVFGPEHAPLEQRMVENAWQEARSLKPDMLLFCAFQFDEEAAKDIDELTPEIAGMQLLKAQMNADLLTDDLRKKRSSNESFWLVGQPDIKILKQKGKGKKIQVEVMGFDYYNPKTGNVESGGKKNIAMWMLDTDYDNRSLFPSQVFFPMSGSGDGWDKLAKNLKAEIDEDKIEAFRGTISLPFEPGESIAVKIIDDRGIESLRVIKM
ncbi:MAG TPA: site-specific DNA-methyltransferase [Methanofastidiosum sp.]|nr:site-specific DNA-methyltransferase [Methanofastidiosum sp.]